MNKYKQVNAISKLLVGGFILSVLVIISVLTSVAGYRLEWWRHPEAFSIFEWASYAAIVAIAFSITGLFKTRSQTKRWGWLLGFLAVVLSLPVIAATLIFEYTATAYPRINDVTTDTQDPPSYWDVPNPIEYPGAAFADIQLASYGDIKPLVLPVSAHQAFEKALQLVKNNGWEVLATDADEGRIEAVESSFLFGFKDEIVLRIMPTDDGAIVDIRSRSRIGRIDRGANARRIRDFINALKNTLTEASAGPGQVFSEPVKPTSISVILCEK